MQKLSKYQQNKIKFKVGQRDGGLCFRWAHMKDVPSPNCTGMGTDCHHIIARSNPFSKTWHISNLCYLCVGCHQMAHRKWFRVALLQKLQSLYGYPYEERQFQEALNAI